MHARIIADRESCYAVMYARIRILIDTGSLKIPTALTGCSMIQCYIYVYTYALH